MTETTFAQTEGKRYSCPKCGGGLQYDITSGQMKCDHCDLLTPVAAFPAESVRETTMEVTEFRCPQCGAAVYSSDTAVTSFCSFCGSDVVLTAKLTRTKRPGRIVPFTITRQQCEQKYRDHLAKYHLVPKTLKAAETISHFRPVYVPFWSYHVSSSGPAQLTATKSYTRGQTRYDDTYSLTVDASIDQKDILYDASTVFEDETAAMLRHTADHAVPFHPAYLSGFFAQAADVQPEAYYPEAAATAGRMFIEKVKNEGSYDTVTAKTDDTAGYFGLPKPAFDQELIMLPVWLLAHRQFDRVVYTAINGCTGDVVCDVPVGLGRVAGVSAGIAVGLFVLLYLFLTLKPDLLLALCSILALITQYRFSAMHEMLYNRKTRAFEPDFSGQRKDFTGPAQLLLNKGAKSANTEKVKKISINALSGIAVVVGVLGVRTIGMLIAAGIDNIYQFTDSAISITLLIVMILMIVHTVRRSVKPGSGLPVPRIISCLACAAGLVFMITAQAEDMLFYGCVIVLLAAAIWELVIIIKAHNEYASRPVPYFDGKEAGI